MDHEYIVIHFDDYLRTLDEKDIYILGDMLLSYEAKDLFKLIIFKRDIGNIDNGLFISQIESNINYFFDSYSDSPIPTDKEFIPTDKESTMLYNILSEYLRNIVHYFYTNNIEKEIINIDMVSVYFDPLYQLYITFHIG